MSSPELVAPARLEELLGGAFPESQDEARLQGLARELRGLSVAAPSTLRARVRSFEAPKRTERLSPKRLALVLIAVALAAGASLGARAYFSGSSVTVVHGEAQLVRKPADGSLGRFSGMPAAPTYRSFPTLTQNLTTRAQDVNMWMDLRVKDADAVSAVSQETQRITRELGGVVGSSSVATQGKQGHAQMTLRIPVGKVEQAVAQLSELGTVTGQKIDTQDLQAPLDTLGRRIARLRSRIRIEVARLASGTLDSTEELQARVHLENLRRNLREAKAGRASIVRRTAMADLTLRFGTGTPGNVEKNESGVSGAAHKAADFLRGAGAVAVFLALVLSPLVVLAILLWLALRARSRRIEARILDQPQPGAPTRSS